MMQPRDAHDDDNDVYSDCAMEQERQHDVLEVELRMRQPPTTSASCIESPVMMSGRSSATSANQQLRSSPVQLVGARKRKALRVVKHQSSPIKADAELNRQVQTTGSGGGNTSMDTGVSSDLSESRPSLIGEEEEEEEEELLDDEEEDEDDLSGDSAADAAEESGGEFYSTRRKRRRQEPKRTSHRRHHSADSDDDELVMDESVSIRKQRRMDDPHQEEENTGRCHSSRNTDEHHLRLKCPECGESFSGRAHLIHHTQRAHPAALTKEDLADIPSILHLVHSAVRENSSATLMVRKDHLFPEPSGDVLITNPPEEYKNEEDDPFSAVLREMKIKGEFPCRLCEAVFPNLRALKGHNRNHLTHAPYRCNMCPSTSHDKGALIRHMRTHNGDRPYECRDCQYAFTTKANCERHLRNRHGKQGRDAVRASIIYHFSEDSAANKDGDHKSGGSRNSSILDLSGEGAELMAGSRSSGLRREEEEDDLTDYGPSDDEVEQDGPLDLTVDVLDLRKRRHEAVPLTVAAPVAVKVAAPSPLVAEPPPPPPPQAVNTVPSKQSVPHYHQPAYFGSPYSGPSIAGLPFFYPGLGGTASYSAFFESKLAEMGAGNPAVNLSALALAAANHDAIRQAQHQQAPSSADTGLMIPTIKKQEHQPPVITSPVKIDKKSGIQLEPGVKMVLKNGVLVKKQKQRRYRTERPFGCEHCTARFTLRSNMERHIKQQHPDIWSTRPRGHRRSACGISSSVGKSSSNSLPTMVELKSPVPNIVPNTVVPVHHMMSESTNMGLKSSTISDQVRQAVQMKLTNNRSHGKKRRNSEQSEEEDEEDEDDQDEDVEDEEEEDGALVIDEPKVNDNRGGKSAEDLASVSKLINNAVAQSFQQYFPREEHHRGAPVSPSDGEPCGTNSAGEEMDEMGECTSISDGHSGVGSDFGGGGGGHAEMGFSNAGPTPGGKSNKKKSAYSNAPHRVSCPYCSRKFPWTSSLRRHILTHTGQKPYKCPQCPLWFTTKSNCDRHLLRKHGNHVSSGGGGGGHSSSSNHSADNSRNVPDRPYKCALCPSSTFATSDNLKKHVDNKHCPGHGRPSSPESIQEDMVTKPSSSPEGTMGQGEHQLPFKCHLCEDFPAGFAERQQVLDHLKREHPEELADLVNKGALLANNDQHHPQQATHTSDEGEDYESIRGKFPDYVNRKVMCAFCLRRFWSAEDLRRHMRTHSGERPFQCDVCSRKFTLKHSMLRHKRKHASGGRVDEDDVDTDEELDEEEEEEESGSEENNLPADNKKVVRLQALWSGSKNKSSARGGRQSGRTPCASDLIGNLLGIQDTSIVEQLMSKPADDAARLLGVTGNRV